MLEGLHDTAIDVMTGESKVACTEALLPQPAAKSVSDMAIANEKLRAMLPLDTPSHQGALNQSMRKN